MTVLYVLDVPENTSVAKVAADDPAVTVVQHAAVAVHRPALRDGDQLAVRCDPVAVRARRDQRGSGTENRARTGTSASSGMRSTTSKSGRPSGDANSALKL